ncbi:Mitochondrial carrier protein Rim2 [Nymphon striatum]|nr:Mitochondrial carrier protein Rim2 [Nymphon striatum]
MLTSSNDVSIKNYPEPYCFKFFAIYSLNRHIIATEGHKALFKGLGANIIGVFPTRAIYFCSYSSAKKFLNQRLTPDTTLVFIGSSMCAGFMSSTLTNPIWIVKTRLQLCQRSNGRFTVKECIKSIYEKGGIPGFWKGISASYIGTSETVIHFVIYEALKAKLKEYHGYTSNERTYWDFVELMLAAATSKSCASLVAYPHEVVRTRLRQEGNKYTSFKQTILTVFREEGYAGLYRGLWTQFVRQIPNTAIVMTTYESVIYLHEVYSTENDYNDN